MPRPKRQAITFAPKKEPDDWAAINIANRVAPYLAIYYEEGYPKIPGALEATHLKMVRWLESLGEQRFRELCQKGKELSAFHAWRAGWFKLMYEAQGILAGMYDDTARTNHTPTLYLDKKQTTADYDRVLCALMAVGEIAAIVLRCHGNDTVILCAVLKKIISIANKHDDIAMEQESAARKVYLQGCIKEIVDRYIIPAPMSMENYELNQTGGIHVN